MENKIQITDTELKIMKILWDKKSATSQEIIKILSESEEKSKSTIKTLLLRLVNKNAVRYEEINSKTYRYYPLISKKEYISQSSDNFIEKIFDGSAKSMIMAFVKEEKITEKELLELIDLIGKE